MSFETRKFFAPVETEGSNTPESQEGLKLKIKQFNRQKMFGFLEDGTFFHESKVTVSKYSGRKNAGADIETSGELFRVQTEQTPKGKSLVSGMTKKAFSEYQEDQKEKGEEKQKQLASETEKEIENEKEAESIKGCSVECSSVEFSNESGLFTSIRTSLVFPDGTKKPASSYGHILTEERAGKDSEIAALRNEVQEKEKVANAERTVQEEKKELEIVPKFFDEKTWTVKKSKDGEILLYSGDYLIYVPKNVSWHSAPQPYLDTHSNVNYTDKVKELFSSLGGSKKIFDELEKYKTKTIVPGSKKMEGVPIYSTPDDNSGDGFRNRVKGGQIMGYKRLPFYDVETVYAVNGTTASFVNHELMSEEEQAEERKREEGTKEKTETKEGNITIEKYEEGYVYFSNGQKINIGQWPEIEDCIGQTVKKIEGNIVTTDAGNTFSVPDEEKYEVSVGAQILKYEYGLLRFSNKRAARVGEWPDALGLVGQSVTSIKDGMITTEDGSTIPIPSYLMPEFPQFDTSSEDTGKNTENG